MNSSTAQRNQLWTPENWKKPVLTKIRFCARRDSPLPGRQSAWAIRFSFLTRATTGDRLVLEFGDGGTSDEETPWHVFDQAGIFDVALTVSNGSNEVSLTEPAYIQVLEVGAMETPFEDSFEAAELRMIGSWWTCPTTADGRW